MWNFVPSLCCRMSSPSLKITVAPLEEAAFTEKMPCGNEGMYNAFLSALWCCILLPIKQTSASHLHSVTPVEYVPLANSTLKFLNFAISLMICEVAPKSTIRPFTKTLEAAPWLVLCIHTLSRLLLEY